MFMFQKPVGLTSGRQMKMGFVLENVASLLSTLATLKLMSQEACTSVKML